MLNRPASYALIPLLATYLLLSACSEDTEIFPGGLPIERVSVDSDGAEGDGHSVIPTISADGRYMSFEADATNLVAGDTNTSRDAFVHDRITGETTRVSVDSAGVEGNDTSADSTISANGRYVVFTSLATNLVASDTNGKQDIFVHDRTTGETTRVSVDSDGVAGNGQSQAPTLSPNGRYAAFASVANNLVAGDTNGTRDIFVHDQTTGETTRVSVDSAGDEGNSASTESVLSADGRYVAFEADATNLVAGDANAKSDIFVHDRDTGETTRVSVDSAGAEATDTSNYPALSADGRYVAFTSLATDLVAADTNASRDIFVHDRTTGETTRVSVDSAGAEGNGVSNYPSISADGRYVAFYSASTDLVAGDTNAAGDVFVHDRNTGTTARVSVDDNGTEGDFGSWGRRISSDGRYVAIYSDATNLVAGDTNAKADVFAAPNPLY